MSDYPVMKATTLQEIYGILQSLQENHTYDVDDESSFFKKRTIRPQFLYRGQSNMEYRLEPGLFRKRKLDDNRSVGAFIRSLEKTIIDDFISESCIYKPEIHREDYLSWLEIAQHHGLPTRLLDFTTNPLVALYFACESSSNKDAFVWIINKEAYARHIKDRTDIPNIDNRSQIEKIVNDEIINPLPDIHRVDKGFIQLPRLYKPNYYDERMAAQSSVFMMWAANQSPLDELICNPKVWMKDDNRKNRNGVIGRILIPKECKKNILLQLDVSGINEKTIYLGLDGVGKYLSQKYKNDGEGTEINTDFQQVVSGACSITLTDTKKSDTL